MSVYLSSDARIERVLISEESLRERVRELAGEIVHDFPPEQPIYLLTVLKGAFIFAADLGRELRRAGARNVQFHFLRAMTYSDGIKGENETHRQVRLQGVPEGLDGACILLVEDILDQGFTLAAVLDSLANGDNISRVRFCVLLEKQLTAPSAAVAAVRSRLHPDYVGFHIPDRWVAGYGLDVNEEFRDLPDVVIVREEYFL